MGWVTLCLTALWPLPVLPQKISSQQRVFNSSDTVTSTKTLGTVEQYLYSIPNHHVVCGVSVNYSQIDIVRDRSTPSNDEEQSRIALEPATSAITNLAFHIKASD
jgi:hypothetical protein